MATNSDPKTLFQRVSSLIKPPGFKRTESAASTTPPAERVQPDEVIARSRIALPRALSRSSAVPTPLPSARITSVAVSTQPSTDAVGGLPVKSQADGGLMPASTAPNAFNFLELARKRLLKQQGAVPRPAIPERTTIVPMPPQVAHVGAPVEVVAQVDDRPEKFAGPEEPIHPEAMVLQDVADSDAPSNAVETDGAKSPEDGLTASPSRQATESRNEPEVPEQDVVRTAPVVETKAPVSALASGLARIARRAKEMRPAEKSASAPTSVAGPLRLMPGHLSSPVGAGTEMTGMERLVAGSLSISAAGSNDWETNPDPDDSSDWLNDGRDDDVGESSLPFVMQDEVSGVLNSVRVFNDWALGSLWTDERDEIRLTGSALIGLTEGLEYRFRGVMKPSRYGEALEVSAYEPVISVDPKALQRYMVKSFKGVGPVKAEKFIEGLLERAVSDLKESRGEHAEVSEQELGNARTSALDALREKLLNRPWEIDLTALASQAKLEDGHNPQEAAKQVVITRNLMLRLGGQKGFKESVAKSLASYLLSEVQKDNSPDGEGTEPGLLGVDLVEASWTKLVVNPYKPIKQAPGYGFGMAEVVARFVGIPKDSGLRLGALSEFAVEQACQRRGHTFLTAKDFLGAVQQVDPTVNAQKALTFALEQKLLVTELSSKRLYTPKLYEAEKSLAKSLAKLLLPAEPLTSRSAQDVKRKLIKDAATINPSFKNGLDDLQLEAVASMLTAPTRLHVLTGGPGTGKTSIIECAVYLLKKKDFQFTAPTGKAAKVLSSRVASLGHTASTIHSMLRGGPEEGFKVNEDNPLTCDVLVVDESTMNGVELADALLKAVSSNAHVIFLGDPGRRATSDKPGRAGQLPSISPGRFMLDLLELPGVNHVNLSKTYRNSGGILEVVNEIGDGVLEVSDREAVRFRGLPSAAVGFASVKQEYIECVMRDGVENTLLVMPKRQGDKSVADWNTSYANAVLRDALNPNGLKLPGTCLFTGDRVLIRQNLSIEQPSDAEKHSLRLGASLAMPGAAMPLGFNPERLSSIDPDLRERSQHLKAGIDFVRLAHDMEASSEGMPDCDESANGEDGANVERVVNGDTGTIVGYSMDPNMPRVGTPKWIHLALDDGRIVDFPGDEMACLDHAYALTVHSAQGSEYKNVIMAVTPGGADFMNQNMIFTGFSRAKNNLMVFADPRELEKIAKISMPGRNSGLVQRVNDLLAESDVASDIDGDCALPISV